MPGPLSADAVVSIPALEASRRADTASWLRFQDAAAGIVGSDALTLITRIETVSDPLILWEIHRELDRRKIAPALRYPTNVSTAQMEFITWLADVYWLTRRKPRHNPGYKAWKRMFGPMSDGWHVCALHVHEFAFKRGYGAAYFTRGFALTDADCRPLLTISSTRQIANRRILRRSSEMRAAILAYTLAHPDKSGERCPADIAKRRHLVWKTYILADRSAAAAARYYKLIYGEEIARQRIPEQVDAAKTAWAKYGTEVLL